MYTSKPKLKRSFYNRDTLVIAREILGKRLVHRSKDGLTVGEIVEVEAYIGPSDPASHAYQGRRTLRTEVQFGPTGHAYIYLNYGKNYCFDITTGPIGRPEVVLVRALRPIYGIELMAKRRGINLKKPLTQKGLRNLCNGPGKLCQAMGIDKGHHGIDICDDVLYLEEGTKIKPEDIATTPRIGIDYAGEGTQYLWRFCLYNCLYVSKRVFLRH